jgi:hypothetical protein
MLPRLLILSLFLPTCVATVVAQSTPDKAPLSSPLPPSTLPSFTLPSSPLPQNGLVLPHEFHVLIPRLFQNVPTNQLQQPLRWKGFDGLRSAPGTYLGLPQTGLAGKLPALAQNTKPCYSIRSYRFSQEDPASDSTRFTDYSTCQPGTQFHVKNAVEVNSR